MSETSGGQEGQEGQGQGQGQGARARTGESAFRSRPSCPSCLAF